MDNIYRTVDETCLEDYRPGYADVLVRHFSDEFGWTEEFTRLVIRDALRFLTVSAIPPTSPEVEDFPQEAHVLVCSPVVDKIVDAIFMDSPLLIWLEKTILHARMIHVPAYAHGATNRVLDNLRYEFTIRLMQSAGYELDRKSIWPRRLPVDYATCSCGNDLEDCKLYAVR